MAEIESKADDELKVQMFIKSVASGSLSERDRLLSYTIGEFYQEVSIFLEECRLREEAYEKMREKNKSK